MSKPWPLAGLLLLLVLAAACTDPFGSGATPTPIFTATPTSTSGPSHTPTITLTPSPIPTNTPVPTPTITPTPLPTEGAVRTPVGGAGGREYEDSLAAMEQATSFRYGLRLEVGPIAARYTLTGTGEYKAPNSYHTEFYSLDYPTEMINIGNRQWVRTNNGPWQAGALSNALYPLGPPPPVGDIIGLLSYALDARLVDAEPVDGKPARHFRFILRPEALPNTIGPYEGLSGGDLWVDAETHRFLRLELVMDPADSAEGNHTVFQMAFQDYGRPVTISPPR